MKKISKVLSLSLMGLCLAPVIAGCGNNNDSEVEVTGDTVVIRIFNSEDYIYLQETEDDLPDLVVQFEEYCREEHHRNVQVIYNCFDTNENMLNELKTGKTSYDLITGSDYTIQKMMSSGMVQRLDLDKVPNYVDHTPAFLREIFQGIKAKSNSTGQELNLDDYAVGYMWGTLGLLYNPTFNLLVERGLEEDKIHEDFQNWDVLWNPDYKNTISIKDSMRDTYSVGIMKVFEDEFYSLKEQHDNGTINDKVYNEKVTEIFNRCDRETTLKVKDALFSLKENIFGFETDSGKEDINTGKIGVNLAWSGDAVYAMDKGDAYGEEGVTLYYSIPESGGNIWFDAWAMPTNEKRSEDQEFFAYEFLNFVCDPVNAAQNMNYIGYTPFIGGDDIIDLVRMWYDARAYVLYEYDDEEDDWVYDEEGNYVLTEEAEANGWTWNSPEVIEQVIEDTGDPVDLSYMFAGTRGVGEDDFEQWEMEFYVEETGRQFFAQYPDNETLKRLAIMSDYGENNINVLDLWEAVKTNSLPLWALIVLIVEAIAAIGVIAYMTISKKVKKDRRIKRLAAKN